MNTDLTTLTKTDGTSTHGKSVVAQVPVTTYDELLQQRMVRTHDRHGLSYSDGNRAMRRGSMRRARTGSSRQPKQFHKQGH